jgi:glycine cleavage system aminomethyltransferase T
MRRQMAGFREAKMFSIYPSARLRPSPFFEATVAEGVTSFTTYNNMLMPTGFGKAEEEYWRIINGASMWDVAVERQVELKGPDAARLAQILCTRDMSKCVEGQGKYVALCNHAGTLINDPIILKRAEDNYWLSIADSNTLFWARAICAERGLNVQITEPDVSPLAVQGPKAEDVVASIFGDWVRGLKYFWFKETVINGIPVAVARSGWSKQGGFEIYLRDGSRGTELWNIVKEAGKAWDIGPGNPNSHERIESGLVSYGGDTDDFTNPFEVRMGKYVDLNVPDDTVGIQALRKIKAEGVKRHQLGVVLDDHAAAGPSFVWFDILADGAKIGSMTNIIWSYRMKKNIGFALVSAAAKAGNRVTIMRGGKAELATLAELPFL